MKKATVSLPDSTSNILIMSIIPAATFVPDGCQLKEMIRPKIMHKLNRALAMVSFVYLDFCTNNEVEQKLQSPNSILRCLWPPH